MVNATPQPLYHQTVQTYGALNVTEGHTGLFQPQDQMEMSGHLRPLTHLFSVKEVLPPLFNRNAEAVAWWVPLNTQVYLGNVAS